MRFLITLLASACAVAAAGLAERYPGDRSIASDPAVLFADNFETGDLSRWQEKRGAMLLTNDAPHSGSLCVRSDMRRGQNEGGHAIKWFLPGADRVYARCYVKFSTNYGYNHHFLTLLGSPANDRWRPFGKAGLKPDGTYFSTGMEPWFAWGKNPPPGELTFYSYFTDMKPDPKMNKYWGNSFFPPGPDVGKAASDRRALPRLGQWQCWEFMLQVNTAPDQADGKQAMWLDGKLVGEWTGIRWRTRDDVKITAFWLQHYGADGSDPTRQYSREEQTVWFDDVVIAHEYVGPMKRQ